MRISDWSSDVCSSDLGEGDPGAAPRVLDDGATVPEAPVRLRRLDHGKRHAVLHAAGGILALQLHEATGDRKSVVSGKSVSVRVDLGGSRIIKKKIIILYYYIPINLILYLYNIH